MSDRPLSIRARKKYKAQIEQAAREKHIASFNHRMELAKQGVDACKRKDYRAALQFHHAYLDSLEKAKGGDLTPKSFDQKSEAAEMLMITGVYWDLAKVYDRIGQKNNSKVKLMINKFVLFSKGMNYQRLSQEMLRKLLTNDRPVNRALFKEAYVKLGGGRCFIATAVEEHCETESVLVLKRFRDEILLKNNFGRAFVRIYYKIGPIIAIHLIRSPWKLFCNG